MKRFNPEKELRKIQHGRRDKILYSVIALLLIISIGSTYALYQVRYSKRIIYTKVAPFSKHDIELAVNIKDVGKQDDFPTRDETTQMGIKFTGIECEKDNVTTKASWDDKEWGLSLFTSGPNKCTVNFGKTHTVKAVVTSNGHVDVETQEVNTNESSAPITITIDEGYGIESITCSNEQKINQEGYTFTVTDVTSDTKCTIKTIKEFVITAHVEANGDVTPIKQYVMPNQDSEEFTITPNANYYIKNITCTNIQKVSRTGNTFKVKDVTNNSECAITLALGTSFSDIIVANNSTIYDDGTEQHNLRYVGSNPSNYIWFNCADYSNPTAETCEKWRIIGFMKDVETENNGTENLVKIIRDEPLPNYYAWDNKPSGRGSSTSSYSYGSSDWSDSRLMMLLNEGYENDSLNASGTTGSLYWNHGTGKCSGGTIADKAVSNETTIDCDFTEEGLKDGTTKNMIESVKWKLGGLSYTEGTANHYEKATARTWYEYERKTEVYSRHQTEWTGKIGLMYPSDYGYATGGGNTYNRATCLAKELYNWYTDCAENDWLLDSSVAQWTIAPETHWSYAVFYVSSNGRVFYQVGGWAHAVRPTLYLKSSVGIKNDETSNGSSEYPYILVP